MKFSLWREGSGGSVLMNVACSQTLYFVFKVRRAGVINNYFSLALRARSRSRARLALAHADVFQKNEKKNKTTSVYRLWWMESAPRLFFAPYRTAFLADTKSYPLYYEHLSEMWLSTLEIGAVQLRSVSEIAPKSPFFCVVRSPLRSDFRVMRKRYPE